MPKMQNPPRLKRQSVKAQRPPLTETVLTRVQEVLQRHKGDCPVFFCFMYPDGELVFMETHERFAVAPSDALVQELESILGEDTVWLKVDTEQLSTAANGNGHKRRGNGRGNGGPDW